MTRDFEAFFTLAGTFGVTLWVVTIALLAIVLTSTKVGNELGTLSLRARNALSRAAALQMSTEMRATFDTSLGQYQAIWFMVEVLPIPMYFQVAMLLSLCVLIPGLPLTWLWVVPAAHVVAWSPFIRFLEANQRRLDATMNETGLETTVCENIPDAPLFNIRVVISRLPLLALFLAILWLPWTIWAVLVSVLVCIIAGIVQTLRVTANIITARS